MSSAVSALSRSAVTVTVCASSQLPVVKVRVSVSSVSSGVSDGFAIVTVTSPVGAAPSTTVYVPTEAAPGFALSSASVSDSAVGVTLTDGAASSSSTTVTVAEGAVVPQV